MNERIRAREVRVLDEEGNQLGVMTPIDAIKIAREQGLDVVEIAPTANPPVCKIIDYGKYLYQLNKKMHDARKHQKVIQVKEVKFRPGTDEHDYQFKKNNALRFLEEGDKVKALVIFRGREMAHKEIGFRMIERLIADVAERGVVETKPRMEGNALLTILAPKKGAAPRSRDQGETVAEA